MVENLKIEAYCMKCRQTREMTQPTAVFTAQAKPAVQGTCPVCGTKMFRMGRTPAHEALTTTHRGSSQTHRQTRHR